jgi:transcriptional regulator with XRE-family HTH domain
MYIMILWLYSKKQVQKSPKSVLRKLREKTGLSQEQMAVQLGVSASIWRRWENTGIEPSMTKKQWKEFCSRVEVPFDQLPDYLSVPIEVSV